VALDAVTLRRFVRGEASLTIGSRDERRREEEGDERGEACRKAAIRRAHRYAVYSREEAAPAPSSDLCA